MTDPRVLWIAITALAAVLVVVVVRRAALALQRSNHLLSALSRSQARFISGADVKTTFEEMLTTLLAVTESEYGFIGEVFRKAEGVPYLKTHAITNIAWNEETRRFYEEFAPQGLEFYNLNTLFGAVLTSGTPVLANDPAADPRRGGTPPGHPPLRTFLGLPFQRGQELVGMVGVANRQGGYDEELIHFLEPFLFTCANLIVGLRHQRARLQAEAALRASEERLRLALQAGQMGLWDWDIEADRSLWDAREFELFGLPGVAGPIETDQFYEYVHPEDRAGLRASLARALETDADYHHEFRIQRTDGQFRWLGGIGRHYRDDKGRPAHMVGINFDITERKHAEEALRRSLQDKEALLKEVHHRVKNNLQIISSLLSLQAQKGGEPAAHTIFAASQNRIRTLALVHETLYRSANFTRIDLARYVEGLCTQLFSAHDVDPQRIRLDLALAGITLDLDRAIPCGLILNELVSNSLRYAFPGVRPGMVVISLGESPEGSYTLRVSDDGVGLPARLDPRSTETMGLHLVHLLTRQLRGTLALDRSAGAAFTIVFPAR